MLVSSTVKSSKTAVFEALHIWQLLPTFSCSSRSIAHEENIVDNALSVVHEIYQRVILECECGEAAMLGGAILEYLTVFLLAIYEQKK